ncbi:RluA family pseudouridine synthase [Fulvivirga sp. M361]|uniref:RluA family pseudouridine synthase n=1 Tax=Fulvivirga sp. M361 TaxID=2594266 RepID=UPI00117A422E|nr:RluA family pseudouridine synthase [Fulvivirga sp. M361]TRX61297.1 RluA family pseudouridine synthase [Fulvivirga sp. M361]
MKKGIPVLYEDNHLIIVNKSGGWLVQGDSTQDETLADNVKDYIKIKYKKPGDVFLGIVHRLDRPVSGAVIFARTSKGLERMNALFRDRKVTKTYWALVKHRPPQTQEELVHWLKKDHIANRTAAFNKEGKETQKAILSYKLIGRIAEYYLLEVEPVTGRAHQIRVQLAKIGCPILGDLKYGGYKAENSRQIYLHSRAVSFEHPVKKEPLTVEAPLPQDDIWNLFSHY